MVISTRVLISADVNNNGTSKSPVHKRSAVATLQEEDSHAASYFAGDSSEGFGQSCQMRLAKCLAGGTIRAGAKYHGQPGGIPGYVPYNCANCF